MQLLIKMFWGGFELIDCKGEFEDSVLVLEDVLVGLGELVDEGGGLGGEVLFLLWEEVVLVGDCLELIEMGLCLALELMYAVFFLID